MATAHDDQKFGFSLASGAADEAVRRVLALPVLEFAGLHSHIGSQIFDTGGFEVAARRVLELAARIHAEHGVAISELDLGGGFGIAYTSEDDAPEVKNLTTGLRAIVTAQCAAFGLPEPRLTIEPGRGIIGPSTVTLYEVGTIKNVDGIRTYVSVDGGMSDNIRTALYDAVVHVRARVAIVGRAADAGAGGGAALRERRHRRQGLPPARRPRARRPAGGGGDRCVLPVAGLQLQPPAAPRRGGGARRRGARDRPPGNA